MRNLAIALLLAGCASLACAQKADCPEAADVTTAQMLGLWRAELVGRGHVGTMLLTPHPEYAESFRGTIDRDGDRRALAGDVEDGGVTIEESADGVHIAAAWVGELVEGSCGREIRGTWTVDGESNGRAFVLRKP